MVHKIFAALAGVVFLFSAFIMGVGAWVSAPGYEGNTSEHFDGDTFRNLERQNDKNFLDVIFWYFNRNQGEWNKISEDEDPPEPYSSPASDSLIQITFVNHSTFLISYGGINILTDPIWSDRASPFTFAGPERMRPPGIRYEDLPPIDLVLISHNHYDHLDSRTLKRLQEDHAPFFLVPLGVDLYLNQIGIYDTHGLDWYDRNQFSEKIYVDAVPAQHFSGRGLFDRDETLWAGYMIGTPQGHIYFAGDTGYGTFFKELGLRYEPIIASIIPIGAYKPRWFMSPVHVDPNEAVQAHLDLNSARSFGMHYGTFPLADDGQFDPVIDLNNIIIALDKDSLIDFASKPFLPAAEGSSYLLNN